MNKVAIGVVLVCFPIIFAVAQSRIEVETGNIFTLSLASNPSTGYLWELSRSLDETKVKLVDSSYQAPHTDRLGAGGVELWRFRAVGRGETTISMKYVRPWEKGGVPAETASFSVIIN